MHIDEKKKFDRRTIDRKIREGEIFQKDYKAYLAGLPDVSDKVYESEQETAGGEGGQKRKGG